MSNKLMYTRGYTYGGGLQTNARTTNDRRASSKAQSAALVALAALAAKQAGGGITRLVMPDIHRPEAEQRATAKRQNLEKIAAKIQQIGVERVERLLIMPDIHAGGSQ